jgi:hypothetical protein
MKYDIIKTDNYLLVVNDSEIREGEYSIDEYKMLYGDVTKDKNLKKLIAHLPLNNSSILNGVNLLPPLEDDVWNEGLEDVLNKLPYTKHLDDGQYNDGVITGFEAGAIWGYNRAKEKYKWTDDDVIRIVEKSRETGLTAEFILLTLQQTRYPIAFECETWYNEFAGIRTNKTITNPQNNTQWVGKYIYQ